MTMLELSDIRVQYGRSPAVSGVSLSAAAGEVVAITGPNGAGKSSVLLAAYGSVVAGGRVMLAGRDVTSSSAIGRARRGLAIVPQGRQLFPRLSVLENLRVFAGVLGLHDSRVDAALDRFPILRTRSKQVAGVLSGGEQQMLAVSRALMADPSVLLLDEIATGLAPMIVESLVGVVNDLAASGAAVIIADPNLGMLLPSVTRGVVLLRGVIAGSAAGGAELSEVYERVMGVGSVALPTLGGSGR